MSRSINKDYINDVKFEEFLEEELSKIQKQVFVKSYLKKKENLLILLKETKN